MHTTTTIELAVPADLAFSVLADFSQNPRWQSGMVRCTWTSSPPHGVGATYEQVASFLGKEILTTFRVVALDPGTSLSIESVVSTFPIQVTRTVEATGPDACKATASVSGQPPWYLRLPGMHTMMQRSIAADYARLKVLLESGGLTPSR